MDSETITVRQVPPFELKGTVVLEIIPLKKNYSRIKLNARKINIRNVEINGYNAQYIYEDPISTLLNIDDVEPSYCKNEYKNILASALKSSDDGELEIILPDELFEVMKEGTSFQEEETFNNDHTSSPPEQDKELLLKSIHSSKLTIKISYDLQSPQCGAHFLTRDIHQFKKKFPQFYCHGSDGMARCWMVCKDSPNYKCTWTINILSPYDFEDACPDIHCDPSKDSSIHDVADNDLDKLIRFFAVAPGIFKSRSLYGEHNQIHTVYEINSLMSSKDILIAVSNFDYIPIPQSTHHAQRLSQLHQDDYDNQNNDLLPGPYCFFMPYRRQHAAYTLGIYSHATNFFEQYFDLKLKFTNIKIVFLENVYNHIIYGAGVVAISSHYLLQENIVEQFYDTLSHIVRAIVSQWILYYLYPQSYDDYWLIVGLLNYFSNIFLKKILGLNEFKYVLRKDMITVCEMDTNQLPLCPSRISKDEALMEIYYNRNSLIYDQKSQRGKFVALKSRIVLHMMEQHSGNNLMQNFIRMILSDAAFGKLHDGISTVHFIEVASKLGTRLNFRTFADQWIYGSGCPIFHFSYSFSRKKMLVEIKFTQKSTNPNFSCSVNKFTGPFTIRIHEPGGTYDTEVCIEDIESRFDIQYHTKYKRIRRKMPLIKGKKQQINQDITKDIINMPEDTSKKHEWQQEEPARFTFEFIRLDPDCNWLCTIDFEQSDFMWASQLQKDKDVASQLDAVIALSKMPSCGTFNVLIDTVYDTNIYYGIRVEAANVLAECSSVGKLYSACTSVINMYKTKYQQNGDNYNFSKIQKSSDFSQIQEYFVQKAILKSISYIRGPDGSAPVECYQLILSLLEHNDSVNYMLADNYYVACLITCLGNIFLPGISQTDQKKYNYQLSNAENAYQNGLSSSIELDIEPEIVYADNKNIQCLGTTGDDRLEAFQKAVSEIQKYGNLDFLINTYHNSIMISCLKVYAGWMSQKVIKKNFNIFFDYAKYGNFIEIRVLSIDALLDLDGLNDKRVFSYLLKLMASDKDPYVRYYVSATLSNKISELALKNSFTEVAIPMSVKASKRDIELENWINMRESLVRDVEVMQHLRDASQIADPRIRVNIFHILAHLYWPFKLDKKIVSKELPKLKIKMPKITSVFAFSPEETDLLPISFKSIVYIVKQFSSIPAADLDKNSHISHDTLESYLLLPPEDAFKKILLSIVTNLQNHSLATHYLDARKFDNAKNSQSPHSHINFNTITQEIHENFYTNNLDAFLQHILPIVEQIAVSIEPRNHFDSEYIMFFIKLTNKYLNIIIQCPELKDRVMISKSILDKLYEPLRLTQPQSNKLSSPLCSEERVLKNPRIKISVSNSSMSDAITDVKEHLTIGQVKLCCSVWAEIYKHSESTWYKQDPKDTYTDAQNAPRSPDYIDIFAMLKNVFLPEFQSAKTFREQFMLTTTNLLGLDNIQNSQAVEQILEVKTLFKKAWRFNQTLYLKTPSSPVRSLSINDDFLKQGIFKDFVIGPEVRQHLLEYLEALKTDVNSFEFLKPVSKSLYPIYYSIIENPMDMTKIKKNLKSNIYSYVFDFEQDIRLMFKNCYKFNHPTGSVYIQGRLLEKKFNAIWNIHELVQISSNYADIASIAQEKTSQVYHRPLKITLKSIGTKTTPQNESSKLSITSTAQELRSAPTEQTLITSPEQLPATPSETPKNYIKNKLNNSPSMAKLDIKTNIASTVLKPSQKNICLDIIKSLESLPQVNNSMENGRSSRKRKNSAKILTPNNSINLPLISKKLLENVYQSLEEFKSDLDSMIQSFLSDRASDYDLYQYGKAIESLFENKYDQFFDASGKKSLQKGSSSSGIIEEIDLDDKLVSPLTKVITSVLSVSSKHDYCNEIKNIDFTEIEIASINNLLSTLLKKDYAIIFSEPVDPDHLKNYYDVIKNPMDLRTVKERLDSNYYNNLAKFDSDMRLIIKNCFTYNFPSSYGYDCGVKFEKFYNLRLKSMSATLIKRYLESLPDDSSLPNTQLIGDIILPPDQHTNNIIRGSRRRSPSSSAKNEESNNSDPNLELNKPEKSLSQSFAKNSKPLRLTLKLRK